MLGWIDSFVEELPRSGMDAAAVRDVGRWLVRAAADREPLKLGIVLCGVAGAGADPDVLHIGGHEEFTLYVAVAVQRSVTEPDLALLNLARRVHGWGRIHLVERLTTSKHAEVRDWLLRGGYHNAVMDEYVAYLVADRCDLRTALGAPEIDQELLDSAGGLIGALLTGGPAQDIDDYRDGVAAVTSYVDHQRRYDLTVQRVGVITEIALWLSSPDADWRARETSGWTSSARAEIAGACNELLSQPTVRALIDTGLASADEREFSAADYVAGLLGFDTFERHMAVLQTDPLRRGSWYHAMRQADESRIDRLLDLAEARLPLDAVSTGPADLVGLGPGFEVHGCLDFIVADLVRYPGKGCRLVQTALQSPVVRNRNMALNVLDAWGLSRWPPGVGETLRRAHDTEPRDEVRERMRGLLDDGRLPAD